MGPFDITKNAPSLSELCAWETGVSGDYSKPTQTLSLLYISFVVATCHSRSGLPRPMGHSVDSVLLGLSCPCTLFSGTTPPLQKRRSRLLLRVNGRKIIEKNCQYTKFQVRKRDCLPLYAHSFFMLGKVRAHLIGKGDKHKLFSSGNLCRCTGYRPILEGYKTFAKVCLHSFKHSPYNYNILL